jgi:hypothetical protein
MKTRATIRAEDQHRGYRLAEHMTAWERAHATPERTREIYREKVVEELVARGVARGAAGKLAAEYRALIGTSQAVAAHPAAVAKDITIFERGESPAEVRERERRERSSGARGRISSVARKARDR